MERLTEKDATGVYTATDPSAALQRLGHWEDLYDAMRQELRSVSAQMQALSAQGKTKTATYRQLFSNKLLLSDLLTRMEIYR